MTTKLRLILEEQIEIFLKQAYDHDDMPNGLIYPEIKRDMASAAELIFDSCMKSSVFTENEFYAK